MAGVGLLALLDDIATILDDVAAMSKVAAKKTAGVLGDDLALNAQQVSGVKADRELPVVWAVAKGSMVNKAILVPAALAISVFLPWLITPLLMIGGAFLCFEGFEKLAHKYLHSARDEAQHKAQHEAAVANQAVDIVQLEKDKVKGAVRTDFILSAEIIVISLGVVAGMALGQQALVLTIIAVVMTVGVYGLEADLGLGDHASRSAGQRLGQVLTYPARRGAGAVHPVRDGRLVGLEDLAVLGRDAPHVSGEGLVGAVDRRDDVAQTRIGVSLRRHDRLHSGAVNRVYRFNCLPPYPPSVTTGSLISSRPERRDRDPGSPLGPGGTPKFRTPTPGSGIPVPETGQSETETR